MPAIAMKNLIPFPAELPSDLATVADPFVRIERDRAARHRTGDIVVIVGTGPIGCWQAVMARDRGASRVFMTDVSGERLEDRPRRGRPRHRRCLGGRRGQRRAEVLSRTGGHGAERVSVAAPAKPAQQAALVMAAKRARRSCTSPGSPSTTP